MTGSVQANVLLHAQWRPRPEALPGSLASHSESTADRWPGHTLRSKSADLSEYRGFGFVAAPHEAEQGGARVGRGRPGWRL